MSRIQPLPDHLINKIAAGEVVERPASVVKELVENALDAAATSVAVDLRDAGRSLIRVRDDGIGMTAEEVRWALRRHATSKIRGEADLDAIATLGFRGEALPAICAVSRFSVLSCPRGAEVGTLVRGEGGAVREEGEAAAPGGTTVEVQDLFFNTPGRLKFLRGARAELATALRILQGLALAYPAVHLAVTHEGRPALAAPRAAFLRDRMGAVYGFDTAGRMIDLSHEGPGVRIEGLVGPPALARGHREDVSLIVNGRPVRDTLLLQSVLEAYRPLLAREQFPLAVVVITVPPSEVDVNVHPTKAWVRFRAPRMVQEALFRAVQDALREPKVVVAHAGALTSGDPEAARAARPDLAGPEVAGSPQGALFREEEPGFAVSRFGKLVGQLHETFIVAADLEEVFFIDQHVAHERVLFERLAREVEAGPLAAQALLFPQPLDLTPDQAAILGEHGKTLDRLGFAIEGFGGRTVLLRAVPVLVRDREPRRLIERLIEEVGGAPQGATTPLDRALAFVACRAAVKAPAPLEPEEMRRLLVDLSATRDPYFCPHGRPVVSRLSLREIRRELRRTW